MKGVFSRYERGRLTDSAVKCCVSFLMGYVGLLANFSVAAAQGSLTPDDVEFAKLASIEDMPEYVKDAITRYTQGSGGLTKDLIRLSTTNRSLVTKVLEGPADGIPLLISRLPKKDQLQLIWARNLAEGACFEVPAGLPLYHGSAPGYDDPFADTARNLRVAKWPFFTSTTTSYDMALGRAGGDASRIYTFLAPQPGLRAIPVVDGMNPKGNEYETILFGTRFRGNRSKVLEISPLSGLPRITARGVVPGAPAMMASVLNRTVPEMGEFVDNSVYTIDRRFNHTPSTFLYTWGDEYSRRMPMTTSVFRYIGNVMDGLNYIFVDRPLDEMLPIREEGCGSIMCSNPHML